jgi:hypothetical protein
MKCSISSRFLLAATVMTPAGAWGCPLCKEAIAELSTLAKAFSYTTLFMLAVPFLVVAIIGTIIVRRYSR